MEARRSSGRTRPRLKGLLVGSAIATSLFGVIAGPASAVQASGGGGHVMRFYNGQTEHWSTTGSVNDASYSSEGPQGYTAAVGTPGTTPLNGCVRDSSGLTDHFLSVTDCASQATPNGTFLRGEGALYTSPGPHRTALYSCLYGRDLFESAAPPADECDHYPGGLGLLGYVSQYDTTPTTCGPLSAVRKVNGQSQADVPVNSPAGIVSIDNVQTTNASVTVPTFQQGDSSATVTAAKSQEGTQSFFSFDVTDRLGRVTHCV